jgi:hypothetical protein
MHSHFKGHDQARQTPGRWHRLQESKVDGLLTGNTAKYIPVFFYVWQMHMGYWWENQTETAHWEDQD